MLQTELRSFWQKIFRFDWTFGVFLVLAICVPRFVLVLHANQTADYSKIGWIMLVSALAPFVFLNKQGRRSIGVVRPRNVTSLLKAFVVGSGFAFLLYFMGEMLYGNTLENWYVYIGKSYNIPDNMPSDQKLIMFSIMALVGMTFSPIGEELYFRGIVHASFAKSFGENKASVMDALAFSITHLAHFGLVFINDQWRLLIIPGLIWVASMFLVSILFNFFKTKSGSLLGAMVCHAAFNLAMIYAIFYLL
ncbi:MAG: CPBP family intramembrane metalloprotease [Saprospiraceae bacterium]|nr:CPBP family intramembrane metalloprotease [Saprospiraceae bacterium]